MKTPKWVRHWMVVAWIAAIVVGAMVTFTVPTAAVLDVCTNCTIDVTWAVGETPGVVPGSFTTESLGVDWNVDEVEYVWLSLDCSETLDDLYIVFETGGDVMEVVRTTPPMGWPSLVEYRSGFESGAYVFGPSGGFSMSPGQASAEFTLMPTEPGCYNLKVYVVEDETPEQEL